MSLLEACILTIVIETAFFACTKYRKMPLFLLLCVGVNGATNLAMNLSVDFLGLPPWTYVPLEILVVIVEYLIYRSFCNVRWNTEEKGTYDRLNRNLFLLTFVANLLSLSIGLLIAFVL